MQKRPVACFIFVLLLQMGVRGQVLQDTLSVALPQAEKMFLDSNLLLLAQKYNVSAQQALVMQAKLWPNPNFSLEHGPLAHVPNPDATFFNNSSTAASLSQLILLAGKRNKQVKLAQANAKLAQYQFFDLLRTLKYTLRTDFFNIYYKQQSAKVYQEEISALQEVAQAFADQQGKGYISEKEVLRIKAQLYSLKSEYNDLVNPINDLESELKLILQVKPAFIVNPVAVPATLARLDPGGFPLHTLLDSAFHNRTDLMIARENAEISKLNYSYQKALAIPDLTLSAAYDQQGSYVNNFQSVGASIDLPFFNRNQGNIRSAESLIESNQISQKSTEATVEENVSRSLQKAFANDKLYRGMDPGFLSDFDRLLHEVLANYKKRNLTLLEFLDFYDAYKQNILQTNQLAFGRVSAFEDLNFYTGTNFFN